MAVYMKYGDIKGDVSEESHKEWLQCSSFAFSTFRSAETAIGQGAQRQGREVSVGDITITKPMCIGSPHLWLASVVGFGKKVQLHITRTGQGAQTNYLEVTLENACVTNYSVVSEGVHHTETLSLNFLKIEMNYIPVKVDGTPGTPIPVGFNIALGEAA
jgi:type VI secretion system secreted protein Hcp